MDGSGVDRPNDLSRVMCLSLYDVYTCMFVYMKIIYIYTYMKKLYMYYKNKLYMYYITRFPCAICTRGGTVLFTIHWLKGSGQMLHPSCCIIQE